MRKLTWKDETYILNERDYAQLLRRFDVGKIKDECIFEKCICGHYQSDFTCGKCPFTYMGEVGCLRVVLNMVAKPFPLALNTNYILLMDYKKGERAIIKIRDWLLTAEKVK